MKIKIPDIIKNNKEDIETVYLHVYLPNRTLNILIRNETLNKGVNFVALSDALYDSSNQLGYSAHYKNASIVHYNFGTKTEAVYLPLV